MAGLASTYIHSSFDNAREVSNLSVNISLINKMENSMGDLYIDSTIKKLSIIKDQLDKEADAFLGGYSIEEAQSKADNAGDLLVHLANRALYGSSARTISNALVREQFVEREELIKRLQANSGIIGDSIAKEIINFLKSSNKLTAGEFATFLKKVLPGGKGATIEVTTAGTNIEALSNLFQIDKIDTKLRKEGEVALTKDIFRVGETLVTSRKGNYRGIIRDIIRQSKFMTKPEVKEKYINNFCNELKEKMKELAKDEIPFLWSQGKTPVEETIEDFIGKLNRELINVLNENKMGDVSNVRGEIGETVRETISQIANSTIVSIKIGDLKDEEGVEKVNKYLKSKGITESLSPMLSHHMDGKESQTDVVLLNNKTKKIARAQSKNHFADYFIKEREGNDPIENFRWMVADNTELYAFLNGLSKTELGMGLGQVDLDNILEAMANNMWFKYHKSAYPDAGKIGFSNSGVTLKSFKEELEGSLEKLLSGQIVNLLGITVQSSINPNLVANASNIFYLLNGRMKRTSDLIGQAIDQLNESENLKLQKQNRMVNVRIDGSKVKDIDLGKGKNSFLPRKLHTLVPQTNVETLEEYWAPTDETFDIGYEMGQEVMEAITINVSLGTDIEVLKRSSIIL